MPGDPSGVRSSSSRRRTAEREELPMRSVRLQARSSGEIGLPVTLSPVMASI